MNKFRTTSFGRTLAQWPLESLADVAFFQEGPGLRKWQWTDSGMKVINGTNVLTDGSFDPSNTSRFISLSEFRDRYAHFAIEPDDIVVVSSGSIGKVSRVRAEHLPMMMNTSVIRFHSADGRRLNDEYLYAFLRSPLFQNQAAAFAIGAAQLNFGPAHIRQMKIALPPLAIQAAIASILTGFDALIENTRRRIRSLERIATGMYRHWARTFPASRQTTFGELARQVRDSVTPSSVSPETVYVGLEHIPRKSVVLTRWGRADQVSSGKWRFQRGDILFGKLRPYFHKVSRAPCPGICSTDAFVIRPNSGYEMIALFLSASEEFVAHATATAGGTDRPRAQWRDLDAYPVSLPTEENMLRISETLTPVVDLMFNLAEQSRVLEQQRDLVLPGLISGEIDVSQLDINTSWLAA